MAKDPLLDFFERHGPQSGAAPKPTPKPGGPGFKPHLGRAAGHMGAKLSEYRFEAAVCAALGAVFAGLYAGLGQNPVTAGVQESVAFALLLSNARARRAIRNAFASARVRRRWDIAVRHCGLPPHARITRVEHIWSGVRLTIRVGRGLSFDAIKDKARPLEAALEIGALRVKCDAENASVGTIVLISRNPLLQRGKNPWPALNEWPSHWDGLPIGIDEDGEQTNICLVQKHVLVGGITGAGKSIMVSMPLAIAALDPSVRLFLLDAKGGLEFAPWARCAESFAKTIEEGIATLSVVRRIMHERLDEMRTRGVEEGRVIRGITEDEGWPLIFVAIDELARFTDNADKKLREEFNSLLEEIIALGRAPGVILLAATQKPEGSVVPTRIRDQFPYRMALRCSTPQASDTILGQGWAAQGFNAQHISEREKGVGFLLSEDGAPIRLRTFFLSDEDVFSLAEQARQIRGKYDGDGNGSGPCGARYGCYGRAYEDRRNAPGADRGI